MEALSDLFAGVEAKVACDHVDWTLFATERTVIVSRTKHHSRNYD